MILNETRDSAGIAVNAGGGRIVFQKSKMLNDSQFVVGKDTLTIRGVGGGVSNAMFLNTHQELRAVALGKLVSTGHFYLLDPDYIYAQFYYDPASTQDDDSVMVIKPTAVGGGAGRLVRYVEDGHVNVKWFGAKGDGITDDWFAIQKSINFVIAHNDKFNKDIFPDGNYLINQALICYKWNGTYYAFFTITLEGEGTFWNASGTGSTITANFKNQFALGIQRGKGCKVRQLKFQGLYSNPATGYAFYSQTFAQASDPTCKDSTTAAYGGIMIDPFTLSATLPIYGAYYTHVDWYRGAGGTGGSTGVEIEDCIINNFVVGISTSINGSTQNAELIKISKVQFTMDKVCIAASQSQEKMNVAEHLACWGGSYCFFSTDHYGAGTKGSWFIRDVNLAGENNMFVSNSAGGYFPSYFSYIWAEGLGKFGIIASNLSQSVENCSIDFAYPDQQFFGTPDYNIYGSAQFKNCMFRYYGTNWPITIYGAARFTDCTFGSTPVSMGYSGFTGGQPQFENCYSIGEGSAFGNTGRTTLAKNSNIFPSSYGQHTIYNSDEGSGSLRESQSTDGTEPLTALLDVTGSKAITISGADRHFKIFTNGEDALYQVDREILFSPSGAEYLPAGIITNVSADSVTISYASTLISDGTYYFRISRPILNKCMFMGDVTAGDNHITGVAVDWGNPNNLVGELIKMPNTVSSNKVGYAVVTAYGAGAFTLSRNAYYTLNNYYFSNGMTKTVERTTVNGNSYDNIMLQKGGYLIDVNYPSALGRTEKFKVIRSGWLDPSTVGATDARRAMMRPVEPFVYSGNPENVLSLPAGSEVNDISTGLTFVKAATTSTAYNGGSTGWELPGVDKIDVRMFGAIANGSTDAAAAITTAHGYAKTAKKKLYFPGLFKINSTLSVDMTDVTWEGEDSTTGLTGDLNCLVAPTAAIRYKFKNLNFISTKDSAGESGKGLVWFNHIDATDGLFDNCWFTCPTANTDAIAYYTNIGDSSVTQHYCRNNVIKNSRFKNIGRIAVDFFNRKFDLAGYSRAGNNHVDNNIFDSTGTKGSYGMAVSFDGAGGPVSFNGNVVVNMLSAGVELQSYDGSEILNNWFYFTTRSFTPITFTPQTNSLNYPTVGNNRSFGNNTYMTIFNTNYGHFYHNTIYGSMNTAANDGVVFLLGSSYNSFDGETYITTGSGALKISSRPGGIGPYGNKPSTGNHWGNSTFIALTGHSSRYLIFIDSSLSTYNSITGSRLFKGVDLDYFYQAAGAANNYAYDNYNDNVYYHPGIDTTHGTGPLISRHELNQILSADSPMTFHNVGDGLPLVTMNESGDSANIPTIKGDLNHIVSLVAGALRIAHPDAKEVGDSNYTVMPTDGMLIFPQPTSPRVFRLTSADSMQNKELILLFYVSNTSQWALSGKWKVAPVGSDTPPYTEDFIDSGIAAGVYRLKTINDQGVWRWQLY